MRAQPTPVNATFGPAALAVLLLLAMSACAPHKPVQQEGEGAVPAVAGIENLDADSAYARGLSAFWTGDYRTAVALFGNLASGGEDKALRSKALFGLACSRLASARTEEDLVAARNAWRDWELSAMGEPAEVDARMLGPFLSNPKLFAPARDGAAREAAKPQPKQPGTGELELSRRLQEKEKEVLQLQRQIKALEAIHREIQAKKKMSQ